MFVEVTIIAFPQGISLSQSSMTFDEQGCTIGRASGNDWVLADPERFLSGNHCKITYENGCYYLVDTSTNGTFVNHSSEPLGKSNRLQLGDGDQFELSDYKFSIRLSQNQTNTTSQDFNHPSADLSINDPFGSPLPPVSVEPELTPLDPFALSMESVDLPLDMTMEESDPLAVLDKSNQPEPLNDFSYSDNAGATNQSVSWPDAAPQVGLIPEGWDDDLGEKKPLDIKPIAPVPIQIPPKTDVAEVQAVEPELTTATADSINVAESEARRRALEQAYRKAKAEVASLKKQLANAKKASTLTTASGVDTSLISAMGFKEDDLSEAKITEINQVSGQIIRQIVEGMMQTLSSRNNVKNTFRMNMTTIQPVENNPLKFSANVDDALENMFLKEGNSYKKPLETVEECFEGIADHQVAILAGIRSAFKSIVNRFEPSVLEERFTKQNKRSFIAISLNEKAKYWEAFHDYYKELFSDLDSSFQYLFGDEFAQAYEEQLQILSLARKEKNKST